MSKEKNRIAKIESLTDEECLERFSEYLGRVQLATELIQDENGLVTGKVLVVVCGDKVMMSDPQALDWPLQPLPMPDETRAN